MILKALGYFKIDEHHGARRATSHSGGISRADDSAVLHQPAAYRHSRSPKILEEGGGLRRWRGLHG